MWENDTYIYSKRMLQNIAANYSTLYEGLPTLYDDITNQWSLAEYKADFDQALSHIGKGYWTGELTDSRLFGKLQRIIIADIQGSPGINQRLRSYAYYLMCKHLNGC